MAEEKVELPQLECQLLDLDPETSPKTVGDLYELQCSGLMPQALDAEKTKINFEQEGFNYALHIVQVTTSSPSEFKAEVTSYLPSVYNNQRFLLSDGEQTFAVEGLSWSYDSVLQEAQKHQQETLNPPPEKLEPYPFFGPVELSYPYWIWVALAVVLAIVFGFVFRWQKKRLQKKRLVEAAISGMGSALTPYQDFNKSLRKVIRKSGGLDELDQAFKVYLTRALIVPAFDWSESEIIRDIRKYHKGVYQDNGRMILRLLREFERAKGKEIHRQDLEQLTELSRKTVEEIDRHQTARRKQREGLR